MWVVDDVTPEEAKKAKAKAMREGLEALMNQQLHALQLANGMQREYHFAKDIGRQWRCDFVWVQHKLALEVEGGTWNGGRHTRAAGFQGDCEKYAHLAIRGYRLIRVTTDQVKSGLAVGWVEAALKTRGA